MRAARVSLHSIVTCDRHGESNPAIFDFELAKLQVIKEDVRKATLCEDI